jgi:hypothetical protein
MSLAMVKEIVTAVAGCKFLFSTEEELQHGLEYAFGQVGLEFFREERLSDGDRIDFLVSRIGVEVKIGGSLAALAAQLLRYAQSPRLDALVLVTARRQHDNLPETLNGKPLTVIVVERAFA